MFRVQSTTILLLAAASSLASAANAPFPIAQSTFGPNQESLINIDVQNFVASQTTAAAFTSAERALETATGAAADLLREYRGDPNLLAEEFFTATATPTWYSVLPTNLRAYVSAVANQQASIVSKDALSSVTEPAPSPTGTAGPTGSDRSGKSGADGRQVAFGGAVVAAVLAGAVLL